MFSKKSRQQFPAPAKQPSEFSKWLDREEAGYAKPSSSDMAEYKAKQDRQNEIRRAVEIKDIRDNFGGGPK